MKKFLNALWKMFRSNLVLKIVAVLFAVVLWSYVLGETNPVREREIGNVPVKWENVESLKDKNLAISGDLKDILDTVNILVRVNQNDLNLLNNKQNVSATVDLSKVNGVGEQTLIVIPDTNYGSVVEVSPKEVPVYIDKYMEKDVPVKAETTGSVPAGYYADTPVVSPDMVRIAGARADVNKVVSAVYTVDLSGLTEGFKRSYEVKLLDASGNEVDPDLFEEAPSVIVDQVVQPVKTVDVDAQGSIIGQDSLAPGFEVTSITSSPSKVRIAGPKELLDTITAIPLVPLSVAGQSADVVTPMNFAPPEGVRVLDVDNIEVTVSIREITETKEYKGVTVKLRNMPPGMAATVDPASVDVTVTAGTAKMSKLPRSQVVPYVDLDGYGPGTYSLPIKFELPGGFIPENFQSATITVSVTIKVK